MIDYLMIVGVSIDLNSYYKGITEEFRVSRKLTTDQAK